MPESRTSNSWRLVGYFGFGKLGPLRWNSLYGHFGRKADKDGGFSWERLDLVKELKSALGA